VNPASETPLEIAARVGAKVAPRSAEIEENRTLPRDLVDDLATAGLFKLFVPARYGGAEVSAADGLAVMEELAFHDGSTGWCVMIAMTTGLIAGFLPPSHAAEIYGPPGAVAGGFAAPMGRGKRVEGGISVNGRWQWGSGIAHCTSIGGGCVVDGRGGRDGDGTSAKFVLFDLDDVEILDTWYVAGLKGTGSTDYEVHDAFVPEERWFALAGAVPREDGPLYRFSFFGLLALGVSAIALGLARRSIEELIGLAATKRPQGSSRPLAERAPVQADVARAEAALRSARSFVADAVGQAWTSVLTGDAVSDEQRRVIRLAATHAMSTSAHVVDLMYTAAGGVAVYEDNALQRVLRDVHVATQHAITSPRTFELAGRMRLGLETDAAQL
jgi:alkylation response protein AidB-like acyl-CoA dehydrogenase